MTNFESLYQKADNEGRIAVNNATIVPMVVGTAKSIFSNEIDETMPTYFVSDGVCGFAEIIVKPGNCPFANFLKKNKLAEKRYCGPGVSIWVSDFDQSLQKKEAYARAFAKVLRENGIDAFMISRMD